MAKNLIPQVCQLLGVEIGEEFKIKDEYADNKYKIYDDGCICYEDPEERGWINSTLSFDSLIKGDLEIVKLPWKPKDGERCYTFGKAPLGGVWKVDVNFWRNDPIDIALFDKGWVYHTREEAKAALPAVAKELGVEYSLGMNND